MRTNQNQKTLHMVQLAMLAALIVVLQFVGTLLSGFTGLPMSFVLIPIVVGATMLGPNEGAILGGIFGIMTIAMGLLGFDKFTNILMNNFGVWKLIVVILLCLIKAMLAGYGSGWVYRLLQKAFKGKNQTLTAVLSSITAPVINTGIFVLGMLLFFFNDMDAIQIALDIPAEAVANATRFIFLVLAGWNFVSEFIINLVISPVCVNVVGKIANKK